MGSVPTFLCPICLQTVVEIEDFMTSQPDAIAHSAAKIISRLKAGGEKTTQALKSLCWRVKGIQVEVNTTEIIIIIIIIVIIIKKEASVFHFYGEKSYIIFQSCV